ncbi:MAG: 2-C-methyl-D-erythritol 2,4-cyclodiphosphate synthase [Deltaproteobacteria bacterium]
MSDVRVGIGYDIHRFAAGRKLVLGGVVLAHKKGLTGHSDADVVLHAVADALLGAVARGDIGQHFPDTDPRFKGAASLELLRRVAGIVKKAGYGVGNVDVMLLLEAPRIAAYRGRMRNNIARVLGIPESRVSVKATTHEGVGAIGRNEAAAAYAVVAVHENGRTKRA